MVGLDRKHQIFPRARVPSAARCLPHLPHSGSARRRSERFHARFAERAKEIAAALPQVLRIGAFRLIACSRRYTYFPPSIGFGQTILRIFHLREMNALPPIGTAGKPKDTV